MHGRGVARRKVISGLAIVAALGISASVPVFVPPAEAQATVPASSAVTAPIQTLDQALLRVMKAGRGTPFATRVQMLTPAVDSALNLSAILRQAVGPNWATLTPDEQKRLLAVFRQYTVATFVENFDSYDGQTITIEPTTRPLGAGAQVVSTVIKSADGTKTHTIDYVVRSDPSGGWKVTDVLADGTISRVAVLRSDFASMLSRGGAPALEASLQQKTQKLESG